MTQSKKAKQRTAGKKEEQRKADKKAEQRKADKKAEQGRKVGKLKSEESKSGSHGKGNSK